MARPDSTSIMMDFFPPVKFYNVQVHYRRKFDSTCIEFFFVKETKWAIMLRFFSVWVVNHKVLYYWCVMWYGNYWITCTYYRYIVFVCPKKKFTSFIFSSSYIKYAVVLKKMSLEERTWRALLCGELEKICFFITIKMICKMFPDEIFFSIRNPLRYLISSFPLLNYPPSH